MSSRPVHLTCALGTIELWLPDGERLAPDPAAADGEIWVWAPAPELGGFSVSHGHAAGRRAEDLLALERRFATLVDVEADERDRADARELRLRVETHQASDLVEDVSGHRARSLERTRRELLRFRFWEGDEAALRAGYRVDALAPADLRSLLDRVTDSVRLVRA